MASNALDRVLSGETHLRRELRENGENFHGLAMSVELRMTASDAFRMLANKPLEDIEKGIVLASLEANQGHRGHTAEALGITTRTLRNKLKHWGLQDPISEPDDADNQNNETDQKVG